MRIGRLSGLVRKEFLQIVRDPSSIAIAFVLPVVLLLLFGYGVSLDASHVRIAVVVEHPTPESQSLLDAFANSKYFDVTVARHRAEVEPGLVNGDFKGMVVLGADLAERGLRGNDSAIQVIVDGADPNTASLVRGYAGGVWLIWLQHEAAARGETLAEPVVADGRVWYNPAVTSRNFLIPGLIAIIMTLIGTLLTALVVAREWERGTMEALMSTPATVVELIAGKLLPYFLLGLGAMVLSVAMAVFLFQVPLRGSIFALFVVSSVFLTAALSTGLFISSVTRNQFAAGQIALVAAFLPAFMLSGFVFEIASMPPFIRAITYIVPARYFVSCLQTLFLTGDIWPVLWPNMLGMAAISTAFLALTARRSRKRLD
jgi:ABC-2 type transport system permease protein